MRTLLIALLCVTLPCAAAARIAIRVPCPVQHAYHDMISAAALAGTCCNDADAAARTGQPCKAGLECQTSPAAPPLPPVVTASPAPSAPLARATPTAPERHPTAIWRPPARI